MLTDTRSYMRCFKDIATVGEGYLMMETVSVLPSGKFGEKSLKR